MTGLRVTTIGAFPKPDFVRLPDWFTTGSILEPEATIATSRIAETDQVRAMVEDGIRTVVRDQVDAGVDVPTDGEVGRENYVHYHCRHLDGIDFDRLTERAVRSGTWQARLPTFVGPVAAREPFLTRDFRAAQAITDRPVKITMPGPMTIMDTTADAYYGNDLDWGHALAGALNHEVVALQGAGCTQIQIDEPAFARYPDRAISYGFDLLDVVFDRAWPSVTRTLHVCCGYPDRLDNPDYPKANPATYLRLAEHVECSGFDAVSLEDAHRHNDLRLFASFEATTVVLGSVQIASSRVEPADAISARVDEVLRVVPADRLVLAPDCGLSMLRRDTAIQKLRNLRAAADGVAA